MREWFLLIMKKFIEAGLFEKADSSEMTYKLKGENDGTQKFLAY